MEVLSDIDTVKGRYPGRNKTLNEGSKAFCASERKDVRQWGWQGPRAKVS